MSRRAAPYARPKPRKPEYEEPPTLSTHPPEPQPERKTVHAEPTRGGVEQHEVELPVTYAGQLRDDDPMRWLLHKTPKTPQPQKVIRGKDAPAQKPPEQPVTEPTARTLADGRTIEHLGEWWGTSLRRETGEPETIEPTVHRTHTPTRPSKEKSEATRGKVIPVEKENAER